MIAPVIDQLAITTPQSATASAAEAMAADLLTFKIGMSVVAAVVIIMAIIGAVVSSTALLLTAAITGAVAALVSVYAGTNLAASNE